ncbi:Metalloprotease [Phytophthora megakarya]|uniref:Metalloprotease n=1 Tax=Phytophthora megakarya TaxID=4795 RepID=A0A225WVE7_9STRA|nr:Metalloprotease [Phytophthora megakarya]
MPTVLYSKRFISALSLILYGYASYPIAVPTSSQSLRLAKGLDAHELDCKDSFAVYVKNIAIRVGVKNPELISIRVGEQSTSASMGTNLTINRFGACIVLPMELYDAFYTPLQLHDTYNIPKRDEIDFVLAHESAHIVKNHSIFTGAFLPASLIGIGVTIHKIPNKLIAGIVGVLGIVGGNLYLSWNLEHEADRVAAESGFAIGGINCFQRKLSRNCALRSVLKTWMITEKGNYLGDITHPLLTSRIERLKLWVPTQSVAIEESNENS